MLGHSWPAIVYSQKHALSAYPILASWLPCCPLAVLSPKRSSCCQFKFLSLERSCHNRPWVCYKNRRMSVWRVIRSGTLGPKGLGTCRAHGPVSQLHQGAIRRVEAGSEKRKVSRLRRACNRDRCQTSSGGVSQTFAAILLKKRPECR